ncbi:MAG: beta-N-acetylhexosaminidase [Oscillospiraceae bacterium]|jgi:beta-N-acetylhexosaminidase|nr:beta-N-acetylhexosaminidase [Oscillospiraceae bacterium]
MPSPGLSPAPTPVPTPDPSPGLSPAPPPDPVLETLEGMTIEQKAAQMLMAGIEGLTAGTDAVAAIRETGAGGVILFSRNVESAEQLSRLTASLRELNGEHIPLLIGVDEEGGRVSRMPPEVENLPAAFTLREKGTDYAALGGVLAAECLTFGFNINFAPVLDIRSNASNTVIGDRAYGSAWEEVTAAGVHVMNGLSGAGVAPVIKHFPGHGDTAADSHTELPVVTKTVDQLWERELLPFQAAIDAGAPAVMVGHILLEAVDDGLPCSLSPRVVNGLLREEMGFRGVVCTDDLTMAAVTGSYDIGEAAVLAAEAGCDLLLVCHGADALLEARDALLAAIDSGRLSEPRLDESVTRLLKLKALYAEPPEDVPTPAEVNAMIREFLG